VCAHHEAQLHTQGGAYVPELLSPAIVAFMNEPEPTLRRQPPVSVPFDASTLDPRAYPVPRVGFGPGGEVRPTPGALAHPHYPGTAPLPSAGRWSSSLTCLCISRMQVEVTCYLYSSLGGGYWVCGGSSRFLHQVTMTLTRGAVRMAADKLWTRSTWGLAMS
jgi:hypothetical protein